MKTLRTYKLKITSTHPKFAELAKSYKEAVNWLSTIVYSRKKINTPNHKDTSCINQLFPW